MATSKKSFTQQQIAKQVAKDQKKNNTQSTASSGQKAASAKSGSSSVSAKTYTGLTQERYNQLRNKGYTKEQINQAYNSKPQMTQDLYNRLRRQGYTQKQIEKGQYDREMFIPWHTQDTADKSFNSWGKDIEDFTSWSNKSAGDISKWDTSKAKTYSDLFQKNAYSARNYMLQLDRLGASRDTEEYKAYQDYYNYFTRAARQISSNNDSYFDYRKNNMYDAGGGVYYSYDQAKQIEQQLRDEADRMKNTPKKVTITPVGGFIDTQSQINEKRIPDMLKRADAIRNWIADQDKHKDEADWYVTNLGRGQDSEQVYQGAAARMADAESQMNDLLSRRPDYYSYGQSDEMGNVYAYDDAAYSKAKNAWDAEYDKFRQEVYLPAKRDYDYAQGYRFNSTIQRANTDDRSIRESIERGKAIAAERQAAVKQAQDEALAVAGQLGAASQSGMASATMYYRAGAKERRAADPSTWPEEKLNAYYLMLYEGRTEEADRLAMLTNDAVQKALDYEQVLKPLDEFQAAHPRWGGVASFAAGTITPLVFGLPEYFANLTEYAVTGEISNANVTPTQISNRMVSNTASQLNEWSGTIDDSTPVVGGKGAGDLYQVAISVAQSALSLATGRFVAGGMGLSVGSEAYKNAVQAVTLTQFFGSAASSGIYDALEDGIDPGQAILLGTFNGMAEVAGEVLSVENLINIGDAKTMRNLLRDVFTQAGIEASEEAFTTLLNTMADTIVKGDKNDLQTAINSYISQGMDPTTAEKQAIKDWLNGMGQDALSGFLSGGFSSVIQTGRANIGTYKRNVTYLNDLASQTAEGSQSRQMAEKYGSRDRLSKFRGNQYAEQVKQDLISNNTDTAVRTIEQRLTELGETGNVHQKAQDIAKAVVGAMTDEEAGGWSMRPSDQISATATANMRQVVDELATAREQYVDYSKPDSTWTDPIMKGRFLDQRILSGNQAYNALYNAERKAENTLKEHTTQVTDLSEQILEAKKELGRLSPTDSTRRTELNNKIREAEKELKSHQDAIFSDGRNTYSDAQKAPTVDIDGTEYNVSGLTMEGKQSQAQVKLSDADGNTMTVSIDDERLPEEFRTLALKINTLGWAAEEAFKHYKAYSDIRTYVYRVQAIQAFASEKISREAFMNSEAVKALNDSVLAEYLYSHGQELYNERQAKVKKATEKLNEKAQKAMEKTGDIDNVRTKGKGNVDIRSGYTVNGVHYEGIQGKKLSAKQNAVVRAIDYISEALNIDYIIFDGDPRGVQGAYRDGGVIAININAGLAKSTPRVLAAETLSHELTHFMEEFAPEEYEVLREAVIKAAFEGNQELFEERVQAQMRMLGPNFQGDKYNQAVKELVADACTTMLQNSNVVTEIARQNMTLAQKMGDFIEQTVKKIKKAIADAFADSDPSDYRKEVKLIEKSFDDILKLYDDALNKAAFTYNAAKTAGVDIAAITKKIEDGEAINPVSEAESENDAPAEGTTDQFQTAKESEEIYNNNLITLRKKHNVYESDEKSLKLAARAVSDLQLSLFDSIEANTDYSEIPNKAKSKEQIKTLGRNISTDLVNNGYVEFRGRTVNNAEDVARMCQCLRDPRFETFRIILTKGNTVVSVRSITSKLPGVVYIGEKITASDADTAKLIKKRMERTGADGWYFVHNHPNGEVEASNEDLYATAKFLNLLGRKTYKGHIILDHNKYGLIEDIPVQDKSGDLVPKASIHKLTGNSDIDFLHQHSVEHPALGTMANRPRLIAELGKKIQTSDDVSVVLYLDSGCKVAEIQEVLNKTFLNNKEFAGYVRNQMTEAGASRAALYTSNNEVYQASKNLVKNGLLIDSIIDTAKKDQLPLFTSARETVDPEPNKIVGKDVTEIRQKVYAQENRYETRDQFQMYDNTADDSMFEAEERQKAWNDLQAENTVLEDTVTQLRKEIAKLTKETAQLRKTDKPEVRMNDARKMARQIIKDTRPEPITTRDKLEIRELTNRLSQQIKEIGDYILETGKNPNEIDYSEIRSMAQDIARDIVNNAEVEIDDGAGTKDMRDEMRAALRNRPIFVPEQYRSDVLDWNDFKKRYRNIFTFKDSGTDIDIVYQSLLEEIPGLLDPNINNPGDMLNELADKWDLLQPKYENPFDDFTNEAINHYTNMILQGALDGTLRQIEPSYADKMNERINRIREDRDAKVEAAEQQGRERLSKLRAEKNARIEQIYHQGIARKQEALAREREAKWAKVEEANRIGRARVKALRTYKNERIQATRKYYQDMRERASTRRKNSETRTKIKGLINDMNSRLLHGTEKKYVPAHLVENTVRILEMIDLDTGRENVKLQERLALLQQQYAALKNDQTFASYAYDPILENLITDMARTVGDTPLRNMNNAQLEKVYQTLRELEHTIRTAVKDKLYGEERNFYESARAAIKTTNAISGSSANALGKATNWYLTNTMRPDVVFERFGGFAKDSEWTKIADMLNRAQRYGMDLQLKFSQPFEELLKDKKNLAKLTSTKAEDMVDIGLKDENGESIKITRDFMLFTYMNLFNEDNIQHVMRGGITVPALKEYLAGRGDRGYGIGSRHAVGISQRLSDINHAIEDSTDANEKAALLQEKEDVLKEGMEYINNLRENIEKNLTEYDQKWIDAWWKFNKMATDVLNETTMNTYGIKKFLVERYFPIITDRNYLNVPMETIIKDMSLENAGFTKERIHASNPIKMMGLADLINMQANRTAQYASIMPAARAFNKFYNKTLPGYSTSVKSALNSKFGSEATKFIENLMADLQGGRHSDFTIFDRLRGRMAQATLSLNPRVALAQTASFPTAAAELGWKPVMKALARGGKNNALISAADRELIQKWSSALWYRSRGYNSVELGDVKNMQQASHKVMDKLGWAMNWINFMDSATVGRLWYAAQYYVDEQNPELQKGSDAYYEKVAEAFNRTIENTQPNYTTLQRPELLRNPNAWIRQLSMFMTQRLQNQSILYGAVAKYMKYRADLASGKNGVTQADVNEMGKRAAWAASSQIAAAATITVFKFLCDALLHRLNAYRRDEDKKLTPESISLAMLNNFAESLASNMFLGSEIYAATKSAITKETYYGIELSGVTTLTDNINNAVKFVQQPSWGLAKKLGESLAQFYGIPLQNGEKIGQAIWYWMEDAMKGEFMEAGVERTDAMNAKLLTEAYASGDKKAIEKYSGTFEDDDDLLDSVRSYIKTGYVSKDKQTISKTKAVKLLVQAGMRQKDAEAKVQEWTCELVTGIPFSKIKEEFMAGNITQSRVIELLQKYGGRDKETAERTARSYACEKETGHPYSDLKEAYILGEVSKNVLEKAVKKYGGMNAEDTQKKLYYYDYLKENPTSDLNENRAVAYMTKLKPAGIKAKDYEDILNKADADKNGAYTQNEVGSWLENKGYSKTQAEALWSAMGPTWKTDFDAWQVKYKADLAGNKNNNVSQKELGPYLVQQINSGKMSLEDAEGYWKIFFSKSSTTFKKWLKKNRYKLG